MRASLVPGERPVSAQRLKYGETPTKTGIARVLDHVLENYTYTSLESLNAVLSLYHVKADRGSEQGIMYRNRGLYYRMIDQEGRKLGAPVKASSFQQRPILNYLEQKFALNQLKLQQSERLRQGLHVKVALDWTLAGHPPKSLHKFRESLQRERVGLVIPPSSWPISEPYTGHGFFYVDFENSTVYRDTDLGEKYSAAPSWKEAAWNRPSVPFSNNNIWRFPQKTAPRSKNPLRIPLNDSKYSSTSPGSMTNGSSNGPKRKS